MVDVCAKEHVEENEEEKPVDAPDDANGEGRVGEVLERHGDKQQNKEGHPFQEQDEAKKANTCHDHIHVMTGHARQGGGTSRLLTIKPSKTGRNRATLHTVELGVRDFARAVDISEGALYRRGVNALVGAAWAAVTTV
jgi:hypothetical protein